MKKNKFKIPFFYPNVTDKIRQAAYEALGKKTITQGKTVFDFEKKSLGYINTKKPIIPSSSEIERNLRSRSAKLRIIEK